MSQLRCEGWWEQDGLGRQSMEDLEIAFDSGRVSGSGVDIVGAFTITGQIEGEKVLLSKQYLGKHHVDYPGSFDGEGTMQGLWRIYGFGGKWMIRVVADSVNDQATATGIVDWP